MLREYKEKEKNKSYHKLITTYRKWLTKNLWTKGDFNLFKSTNLLNKQRFSNIITPIAFGSLPLTFATLPFTGEMTNYSQKKVLGLFVLLLVLYIITLVVFAAIITNSLRRNQRIKAMQTGCKQTKFDFLLAIIDDKKATKIEFTVSLIIFSFILLIASLMSSSLPTVKEIIVNPYNLRFY